MNENKLGSKPQATESDNLKKRNLFSGFSFVELMVAVGIMSIMVLTTMVLFENSNRAMKNLSTTGTFTDFISSLRYSLISSGNLCITNIGDTANIASPVVNIAAPATTILNLNFIRSVAGDKYVEVGQPLRGEPGTIISSILLQNFLSIGGASYSADLVVNLTKSKDSLGSPTTSKFIGVTVTVDTTGKIVSCNANVETLQATCTSFGGVFDTATAKCTLPIDAAGTCSVVGGTFNTTTNTCALPTAPTAPPPPPASTTCYCPYNGATITNGSYCIQSLGCMKNNYLCVAGTLAFMSTTPCPPTGR